MKTKKVTQKIREKKSENKIKFINKRKKMKENDAKEREKIN